MIKSVISLGAALAAAVVSTTAASAVELKETWRLEGLEAPESVALSADGRFFYVSNIKGDGDIKDGDGYIARVSRDGKMLEKTWATGMNAPKGLALHGGRLFAADIDTVMELDAATGKTIKAYPVEGAKFLNDVAIAPGERADDAVVLVSDSGMARINALDHGVISVWLADPQLRAINGLLPEKDRLVVTTMTGLLLAVDWKTRAITRLAEGLGDGDGVARLADGRYVVSEWPGRLFEVSPDGSNRVIADIRKEEAYINDFLLADGQLIVPHMKAGRLAAYRIDD